MNDQSLLARRTALGSIPTAVTLALLPAGLVGGVLAAVGGTDLVAGLTAAVVGLALAAWFAVGSAAHAVALVDAGLCPDCGGDGLHYSSVGAVYDCSGCRGTGKP